MTRSHRSLTSLPWRAASCAVVLALAACGADGEPADGGIDARDGGSTDRISPQDLDGDEWANEVDNCSMIYNPEQRDRDRDGIGDLCDSCPATPNSGSAGQPGQSACALVREAEPNDVQAQPLTLRAVGEIAAVQGTLERASGADRPVDRFELMLAAQTMIHIRVARAGSTSLLEPELVVTGGAYTTARTASGLFVAERDIYASAAGVYRVELRDRRTDTAAGGELYGYELSIVVRDVVPEALTPPVRARTLRLDPPGTLGVYAVELAAAMRTRVLVESPISRAHPTGIDPIVVVEAPDGTHLGESDDFLPTRRDARYFGPFPGGRARVVVDHVEVIGTDDLELELTIDQPPDNFELEPNDTADLATPLLFPGQSRGQIDAPTDGIADVDVWSFTAAAGTVASFRALVDASSQIDPYLRVGRFVDGQLEQLYANADFSGPSARVEAILPQAGTYAVVVTDQRNRPGAMPRGGPLFAYTVFSERLGIQPQGELTTSGELTGTLDQGGRLVRYLVTASVGPSLLALRTTATGAPADELVPYIRVYRPGATGVLGEGERATAVILPTPGTYVLAVHNALQGAGALGYTFTLAARLVGLLEVAEAEPNDTAAQALTTLPAALTGRVDAPSDVDAYAIVLDVGEGLGVTVHPAAPGLAVALRAPDGSVAAANAAALATFRAPSAGTYTLRVTAAAAVDYQLALERR